MTWDDVPQKAQPRGKFWVIAAMAVVAVAAFLLGSGTSGVATDARDPEVLAIKTADTDDVELPPAPGGGAEVNPSEPNPGDSPVADSSESVDIRKDDAPVIPDADGVTLAVLVGALNGSGTSASVGLDVIDLGSGTRWTRDVSAPSFGFFGFSDQIARRGEELLIATPEGLLGVNADLSASILLSQPTAAFYPRPDGRGGWVHLVDMDSGRPEIGRIGYLASDNSLSSQFKLPAFGRPHAATNGGLLVTAGESLVLVAPSGDSRTLTQGAYLASVGDLVAVLQCSDGLDCDFVVLNIDGDELSRFPADGRFTPNQFLPTASLSPDGTMLAFMELTNFGQNLYMVSTKDGTPIQLPQEVVAVETVPKWTADSNAVAIVSGGELFWWEIGRQNVQPIAVRGDIAGVLVMDDTFVDFSRLP